MMNKSLPRIALAVVMQNEELFLREHLEYHRRIGVSRFYLFLDRCTDRTRDIAGTFPEAHTEDIPDFVRKDSLYLSDIQCWCYDKALEYARQEKIEWLLVLDVDEFAFAGNSTDLFSSVMGAACALSTPESLQKAHLLPLLENLPGHCEMVALPTCESVPIVLPTGSPYYNQIYFQGPQPLPRKILDPDTGEEHLWEQVLGHDGGKSIVHTGADVQAKSPHKWTRNQNIKLPARPKNIPFPSVRAGLHYHFFIVSPEHWLEKYSKFHHFPLHWNGGKLIELPKRSWIRATQKFSREEALAYAENSVFLKEDEAEALVRRGTLIRDETIRDILTIFPIRS